MSFRIQVSGATEDAVNSVVPTLVADLVASGITDSDPTLWGAAAEAEAGKRLGWVQAVSVSRPLVAEIMALREEFVSAGVTHFILAGMGGSSLAPEVITETAGVELTILDSTAPGQVLRALNDRLEDSVLVVSSKSGSTVETDSQKRTWEQAFKAVGIDPRTRIVIVTDPGSPMDLSARQAGYRVFNADPDVGGRYSALTAFGLVPSGLAGVDISELLDEAEAVLLELAVDSADNPGLVLGAAISSTTPFRDKLGIVPDGTHIKGLGNWIEQLIAESTGKQGSGILPVVLDTLAPELTESLPDLHVVRIVKDATVHHLIPNNRHHDDILISGSLGAQFMVWEYAVVVAGRLLGINPFDQPDVESAKEATRGLLDARPEPTTPAFTADAVQVRATHGLLDNVSTIEGCIDALLARLPSNGYVAVQAYVDRTAIPQLSGVRNLLAARSGRPVTFGWGPRFLHSTGQFHKGGPAVGVFLQITQDAAEDLAIPGRPFGYAELIQAQAMGDAVVLADHGRPVLTLNLTHPEDDLVALFGALN